MSATKSAGNSHKTRRDTIVEPIVMVALAPIASLAAKPVQTCIAQVIGSRRPTTLVNALGSSIGEPPLSYSLMSDQRPLYPRKRTKTGAVGLSA